MTKAGARPRIIISFFQRGLHAEYGPARPRLPYLFW